jgi:Fic family protein
MTESQTSTDVVHLDEYESGRYVSQGSYEGFLPSPVNHGWVWDDPRINTLLEEATQALGELNAFSRIVPDVDLFIQLHVVREATDSSRIEGTRTEMEEAIRPEEEVDPDRRDDWREVQNYVQAMREAIDALDTLPLSTRLLKQTHRTLMRDVRGQNRQPGEYRRSQNWIGASLDDAVYVPPSHHEIGRLMGDLEEFWHSESIQVPHLIRIAISHYQFETIHPFLDGNGRIGRLLIPLYLIRHGLLAKPSLYLSSYIERHRAAYYDALMTVRAPDDLGQWIRFFLVAVRETARQGCDTFEDLLSLRERVEEQITTLGRKAANARTLLTRLYREPYVRSAKNVAEYLDVTPKTARSLLQDLEDLGILEETTGKQRNRRYVFAEYVDLFTR